MLAKTSSSGKEKRTYPSKEAATAAAKADTAEMKRKAHRLSLQMKGRADLMAEGRLALSGFRPGLNQTWLVSQVVHTVSPDGGWSAAVEAELAKT